jgi:hypothetical protein
MGGEYFLHVRRLFWREAKIFEPYLLIPEKGQQGVKLPLFQIASSTAIGTADLDGIFQAVRVHGAAPWATHLEQRSARRGRGFLALGYAKVVINGIIIGVEGLPIHSAPHGGPLQQVNTSTRLFYPFKTGFRVLARQVGILTLIIVSACALEKLGYGLGRAAACGWLFDLTIDEQLFAPTGEVLPGITLAVLEDELFNLFFMVCSTVTAQEAIQTG